MYLYTVVEAMVGIIAGLVIAIGTKKADGVIYGKLDKAGMITNILLIIVYACLLPLCLFLGMISNPQYDGFLGILGWIVAVVIASAALFCGLGLGFSVALRKKGRSKLSFAVQFAGVGGIGLTLAFYFIFTGNLLKYLN